MVTLGLISQVPRKAKLYLRSHEDEEEVEDDAVTLSSMAVIDVDFGTLEVRIIETATVFCDLTSFLSEDEDGNGDDVPERLFPFPPP